LFVASYYLTKRFSDSNEVKKGWVVSRRNEQVKIKKSPDTIGILVYQIDVYGISDRRKQEANIPFAMHLMDFVRKKKKERERSITNIWREWNHPDWE
jgi:hypothetical protein